MNNTVYAVQAQDNMFSAISIVETTQERAINGMTYGQVDSFYDTKKDAQARATQIKNARTRAMR